MPLCRPRTGLAGRHVSIIGRKMEKLRAVAAEFEEDGYQLSLHSCDIREEDAVKSTIKEIVAQRGVIHGLVSNAGGQFPAPLTAINQKGWETVIRTNLTGGFLVAKGNLHAKHAKARRSDCQHRG